MLRRRPPKTAGPLAKLGITAGYTTAADRAAAIGCSRSHLLHCERGFQPPGLELMDRMASVYKVSPESVEQAVEKVMETLRKRGAA